MGWLSRLFSRRYRPTSPIAGLCDGWVEVEGRVEALDELVSPLTGERGVLMQYRASTPSAVGAFGDLPGNALRLAVAGSQALDFVLRDDSGAALVRVARGRDIGELHAELVERHGLGLRAEVSMVAAGHRVMVRGEVIEVLRSSPHRRAPYGVVLEAASVHSVA